MEHATHALYESFVYALEGLTLSDSAVPSLCDDWLLRINRTTPVRACHMERLLNLMAVDEKEKR